MSDAPDPVEAARRYARLAASYDRRVRFVGRMRIAAVRRLGLKVGDHVLDVGCGTGANLVHLVRAVGEQGRVTGIELTEEMAAVARVRAAEAGWSNVEVVVGDAKTAPMPGMVDGALLFLTHDLMRTPEALERVVAACRPGASVVAFGPKRAPSWAWPVNTLVRAISKTYVTTFEGFDAPWSHLEPMLDGFEIRSAGLGAVYLGRGRVPN
jgi:ubiquinone/menaquinone biosynthesis C-methylase UbiE